MSNVHNAMLSFLSFVTGVLVGLVLALLFAPTSGSELRSKIRQEAEADWAKVMEEWDKNLADMRRTMEETQNELKTYQVKTLEEIKGQLDKVQAKLGSSEAA